MNATSLIQQPFIQVALPILIGFFLTVVSQNKHFDDVNRRLDEIIKRLDRIETKLDDHEHRVTRLEERTSPLRA